MPLLAYRVVNESVRRFFPKTLSKKESHEFLKKIKRRDIEDGVTFWGVIRKDDKKFLGICSLLKQVIDGINEIEVGYRISDEFWGKGTERKQLKDVLSTKDELKLPSIISLIIKENMQSIRVAEKNGLQIEKEAMFHG